MCHYFKDPSLLALFFEILFLREPMTLKYDREFAAWSRANEHCKLRLPLQPRGCELPSLLVRLKLRNWATDIGFNLFFNVPR